MKNQIWLESVMGCPLMLPWIGQATKKYVTHCESISFRDEYERDCVISLLFFYMINCMIVELVYAAYELSVCSQGILTFSGICVIIDTKEVVS